MVVTGFKIEDGPKPGPQRLAGPSTYKIVDVQRLQTDLTIGRIEGNPRHGPRLLTETTMGIKTGVVHRHLAGFIMEVGIRVMVVHKHQIGSSTEDRIRIVVVPRHRIGRSMGDGIGVCKHLIDLLGLTAGPDQGECFCLLNLFDVLYFY